MSFLTLLVSVAFAEDAWTKGAVEVHRWSAGTPNPVVRSLEAGEKVEVVIRDGDQVRVRIGVDFGWVKAAELTDVAPPPDPSEGIVPPF